MDVDFTAQALGGLSGLTVADITALKDRLRSLAEPLSEGGQRSAVFDVGPGLVSCHFERTPTLVLVRELKLLALQRPAIRR